MSITMRIERLEQKANAAVSDLAHLTDEQLLDQIKRLADEIGYTICFDEPLEKYLADMQRKITV